MVKHTRLCGVLAIGIALSTVNWLAGSYQATGDKKEGAQNPATTPAPRMAKGGVADAGWIKRHDGFVDIAKKGDVDVLFLGDSITDAWRNKAAKPTWDKYFAPLKSANFGISGDGTQHVLWRIQNGELDGIKPKVVMLMIGTNNMGNNTAPQIADGVTAIVKTIHDKSKDSKVLLLAIFPRADKLTMTVKGIKEKITATNEIISKLDDGGKTVKYMDIGSKFLEPDGTLSDKIMYDYLHLTDKGYQIWGDAVAATVQEMAGGDAKK